MSAHDRQRTISVTIVRKYRRPPEAVYSAWTQPALLARWLVPDTDLVEAVATDLREGGAFRLAGVHDDGGRYVVSGMYLELVPGRRVSMSWAYQGPVLTLKADGSVVTAVLRRIGGALTECTLTHEWMPDRIPTVAGGQIAREALVV